MPCQRYARGPLSKLERTPPQTKINVTSKSPVGDISVVTLIRTDTTLDHSQKAEKVCVLMGSCAPGRPRRRQRVVLAERASHNACIGARLAMRKRGVGSSSQADHLMRNTAMDDSIGGS